MQCQCPFPHLLRVKKTRTCHPKINYYELKAIKQSRKTTLHSPPLLHKDRLYTSSFYLRQTLTNSGKVPEDSANRLDSSFLPCIYLPPVVALGCLKLLSFVLSFLYKCVVLCWWFCISCSSKPLLLSYFHRSFSYLMCAVHVNKLFFFLICFFVKESQLKT